MLSKIPVPHLRNARIPIDRQGEEGVFVVQFFILSIAEQFKEGNAKNGRFYMTIEPDGGKKEMIFDVTHVTLNSPDAAPDGVTHFNPMKMYTFK